MELKATRTLGDNDVEESERLATRTLRDIFSCDAILSLKLVENFDFLKNVNERR